MLEVFHGRVRQDEVGSDREEGKSEAMVSVSASCVAFIQRIMRDYVCVSSLQSVLLDISPASVQGGEQLLFLRLETD